MFNNGGGGPDQKKVQAMRDFVRSMDKEHTGVVSLQNMQKVLRVFGFKAPPGLGREQLVDYEAVIQQVASQ
jgi:Ca2+-binding EF-hand superfamily protein